MRPTIRKLFAAGMVVSACAFASSAEAQSTSRKKAKKADPVAEQNARRAHAKLHELCEDGVWSIHVPNPCIRHQDKVARQNRAATKARDRAVLAAARRGRPVVATALPESGGH